MIEKRGRRGRWRGTLTELQREWQCCRCSRGREQWREIQAITAKLLSVRSLPVAGCLRGGGFVGIGMRDRAELRDEKRNHSKRCDAKLPAMRPIEQSQALRQLEFTTSES